MTEAKTNSPLPGASILIKGTYLWAVSNQKGEFTIQGVQEGKYNLEVSFLGYVPATNPVNVRSNIIRRRDMQLSLFANLGHNENKLVKISNSLKAYNDLVDQKYAELGNYDADAAKPFRKYEEGVSTTAISAVKSHGIDPATGKEIFEKRDGTLTTKWDSADMISCGDTEPDIQGTFGFNFSWKKFSLYTTFMYEYGGQRYNSTLVSKVENADILQLLT